MDSDDARPPFGVLLRRFRLSAGLSQEMLAERARISVQAVSALERGARRAPQRQTLELITHALSLNATNRALLEAAAVTSARRRPRETVERSNLPVSLNSFLGRERELEALVCTISSARLVTIWGAPGVGKTRLAMELANAVQKGFPDGARLVDLTRITDPGRVASALAAAIGVSEEQDRELSETITAQLSRSRALIVLDNCEHVIDECARLVDGLLRATRGVTFLCTSREPLRVTGEHVFPLDPLPVSESADSPAVQLFVDRAAQSGAFGIEGDRRTVAAICRRLDGIPLAIELTAARTRAMTPRQIARALEERFDVATGGSRTAVRRQQTLRGALEWSYDLLAPGEQRLMRRLCVFPGGWSIDDATAILPDDERSVVADALEGLVDKALVVVDPIGDVRYRMLEMTRQYASERLREAGELELCEQLRMARHRALVERAFLAWRAKDDGPNRALGPDLENFTATLDWALTRKMDVDGGAILAGQLSPFFELLGMQVDGIRWAKAAIAAFGPDASPEAIVQAWMGLARLSRRVELHQQAYEASLRARAFAGRVDPILRGNLLAQMAVHAAAAGHPDEGHAALAEALAVFRSVGNDLGIRSCLENRAEMALSEGDFASAKESFTDLIAAMRKTGTLATRFGAVHLVSLGEAQYGLGDVPAAVEAARQALAIANDLSVAQIMACAMLNLAAYLMELDDLQAARELTTEAFAIAVEKRYAGLTTLAIQYIALLDALRGRCAETAPALGYVDRVFAETGFRRGHTEQRARDRLVTVLNDALGSDAVARAIASGAGMSEAEVRHTLHLP